MDQYKERAKSARLKVLDMIFKAQSSHIGSNFSCIDILAVLFSKIDFSKDKFICSAGWKAASVYYFLYEKGIVTEQELDSYCQGDSPFIGLVEPMGRPGLEFAGGSMGYGLPAAVGFALAKKMKGEEGTVYCLMSDGELAIGTTWEAALIAAHHKLDNLVVIVDQNGFQAMGTTDDILNTNRTDVWYDLGWETHYIKGHNFENMEAALSTYYPNGGQPAPLIIFADTVKGKGVSFMENNNLYHYKNLSLVEYGLAKEELLNA